MSDGSRARGRRVPRPAHDAPVGDPRGGRRGPRRPVPDRGPLAVGPVRVAQRRDRPRQRELVGAGRAGGRDPGRAGRRRAGQDEVWQRVELEGEYVTDATVLLRNRPVGGRGGYHVLVPFEARVGGQDVVMVIDRGFVPARHRRVAARRRPRAAVGHRDRRGVAAGRRARRRPRRAPRAGAGDLDRQVLAAGPDGAAWAEGRTVGAYGALRAEEPAPETRARRRCPSRTPTRGRTCPTRSSGASSRSARSAGTSCCGAASEGRCAARPCRRATCCSRPARGRTPTACERAGRPANGVRRLRTRKTR